MNTDYGPHLQKIWILATGTRGDVQPFVAVAQALVKRGYTVTFFTSENFVPFVKSFGITAVAVRPSTEELFKYDEMKINKYLGGTTLDSIEGLYLQNKIGATISKASIEERIQNDKAPDLTIASPMIMGLAW